MKIFKFNKSYTLSQKLGKHHGLEIQVGYNKDWAYWYISSNLTRKCDHAGFGLQLEILGVYLYFSIYDGRHWDYKNERWELNDNSNTNS